MYVASCLARAGDEVVLDNQAAADCAAAAPYHEVSGVDVRQPLAQALQRKSLVPGWVPGHREEHEARTPEEAQDIRGNNLSDSLASMGSEPPLTPYTPDAPHGIGVGGTEAPTPAKKWSTAMRPHATPEGAHWATWLPLKGERRRLWLQWVWGNVWWRGCMPPWKKWAQPCALCGSTHQGTAQTCLVQRGAWRTLFVDEWAKTWGPWEPMARQWLSTATYDDLARVAKFHIPLSLVELIPPDHMLDFRYRVAVHQYQCIKLAGELRHNLPMPQNSLEEPRSSSGGTAIWSTAFRRRAQCSPPTEEHLVRQCHYNPRKRAVAGSQQRSAKPKRDHRLETRRTVTKLLRQPYTVSRACMVIRALPVLTGDGLTCAETFLDTGMHLTPSVTPTKPWRPVTGATYMAANNLMQTAQSLIRETVRGILAQRKVSVGVAVTWASHVDACARVLAVYAQRTRFWFHHSVRVTLYAAHRARQRFLLGTLSSLRRLTTRFLRHIQMFELALRLALPHSAAVARANISHQQLPYHKFRTWAAMMTHKLGDKDTWLTAAMCDTLQLPPHVTLGLLPTH